MLRAYFCFFGITISVSFVLLYFSIFKFTLMSMLLYCSNNVTFSTAFRILIFDEFTCLSSSFVNPRSQAHIRKMLGVTWLWSIHLCFFACFIFWSSYSMVQFIWFNLAVLFRSQPTLYITVQRKYWKSII